MFTSRSPNRFSAWKLEKNPLMLLAKEGKSNHFEIYPKSPILLNNSLPSKDMGKGKYPTVAPLAFEVEEEKQPAPVPSILPVSSNGGGREAEKHL